jgi:hypothetical protein
MLVRPRLHKASCGPPRFMGCACSNRPFTIDFTTSLYFHNHDEGLLLGMSDPTQEYGFHHHYSEERLPALNDAARRVRLSWSICRSNVAGRDCMR